MVTLPSTMLTCMHAPQQNTLQIVVALATLKLCEACRHYYIPADSVSDKQAQQRLAHLASDSCLVCCPVNFHLGGKGCLGPLQQGSQHLPCESRMIIV